LSKLWVNYGGVGKNHIFLSRTRHISETVENRVLVTMDHLQETTHILFAYFCIQSFTMCMRS